MLLRELGQRPLTHLWWQRVVSFGIACVICRAIACIDRVSLEVALDDVANANTRQVRNWACSFH